MNIAMNILHLFIIIGTNSVLTQTENVTTSFEGKSQLKTIVQGNQYILWLYSYLLLNFQMKY